MNVIIHNDERRSQRDATLREYGINPERAMQPLRGRWQTALLRKPMRRMQRQENIRR